MSQKILDLCNTFPNSDIMREIERLVIQQDEVLEELRLIFSSIANGDNLYTKVSKGLADDVLDRIAEVI